MAISGPTTLMPWISIFSANGLMAATRRSASLPLLARVMKPAARSSVADAVRAQGRLMSMLMA